MLVDYERHQALVEMTALFDDAVFFDAGFTASYLETLVMTETGIEVLSRVPRTLTVVG